MRVYFELNEVRNFKLGGRIIRVLVCLNMYERTNVSHCLWWHRSAFQLLSGGQKLTFPQSFVTHLQDRLSSVLYIKAPLDLH